MWTYLYNFLFDRFLHKPEIGPRVSSNNFEDHLYGKRFKFSDLGCHSNGFLSETSSRVVSMHKESVKENNDDEVECCVIAEIPRRKRPENSVSLQKTVPLSFKEISKHNDSPKPFTNHIEKNRHDKDIEILKESNYSCKNRLEKHQTINHRFFVSQRAPLSQGKMVKSRLSFKNNLKKNMNFLQESYRLMEKYQYIQLLQTQTTHNLLPGKRPLKKLTFKPEVIPVIDLTDNNTNEVHELLKPSRNSEGDDVVVLGEVPGVRTLQDMLKIKPVGTKDIQGIISRHSSNKSTLLDIDLLKNNGISLLDDDSDQEGTSFEDLEEKLRNFMQITSSNTQKVVDKESEKEYLLLQFTSEQEEKIKKALVPQPSHEVLSEGFGLKITRRDMQTLFGLNWLNDEVINFYMNLIMERSKSNKALPKVYAFNTFFYPKLVSSGYTSLRRWTKKVDIFSFDIILVPIHLGMHWCLSVIDFRSKSIQCYDSVGSPNDTCLELLLLFLYAESLDKKKKVFSTSNWKKINKEDIPQQMNGSDCGVFSCMFAEHLARNSKILFTQNDMPYFRKKMVIEILEKKILI